MKHAIESSCLRFFSFFAVLLAVSCAGAPKIIESSAVVPETPPLAQERPEPPEYIMGAGKVSRENLAAFLLRNNSAIGEEYINSLALLYIEESALEGVNHDVAFSQMCLETGFLRYGGLVTPDMNNFCGLGAISAEQPGLSFPDPETGVRAHIQHLKGYASDEPLNQELVNPRYRYLVMLKRIGTAPTIQGLSGTWATDPLYDQKIAAILQRLYNFSF